MPRLLLLISTAFLVLPIALPAAAQTSVGPPIAYSTQTEVFLVNPTGSGKVRLHRSRSNNYISSVSLRPGGGQVAFVEDWAVRFLDFDESGKVIGSIRTIASPCFRLANVRYHPDGQSVLYHELCGNKSEIKRSAIPVAGAPAPVPTILYSENSPEIYLYETAWHPSGTSLIYALSNATGHELRQLNIGGSDDLLLAQTREQIRYVDVSPDGSKVLFSNVALGSSLGVGYTRQFTIGSQTVDWSFKGQHARYAPSGSDILFIDYITYNQRFLRLRKADGLPGQIGDRAIYWSVDWRK